MAITNKHHLAEGACTTHMKALGMFNQCIIVYF